MEIIPSLTEMDLYNWIENAFIYSFNSVRACWEILLSLLFADFFENQFFIFRVIKRVLVWNKLFAKVISRQHWQETS